MDININISKTHVFAETFFKKRPKSAGAPASGSLIFHFSASGVLAILADGPAEKPKVKNFLRLDVPAAHASRENAKVLSDYLSSLGIREPSWVTAVASDGLSFRQLTMPSMPEADLKQAVGWELKKKFFVNPEEQVIGVSVGQEIEGEEGPEKRVSVFHADKKAVLARLALLQMARLPLHAIWPGFATLSCMAGSGAPEDRDLMVVDIGPSVRIGAVQNGAAMLMRTVAATASWTDLEVDRLAEEVRKSMEFYETQKAARPIAHVWLTGSGCNLEAIAGQLQKRLSLEVRAASGSPFLSDALTEEQKSVVLSQPSLFAEALGALSMRTEALNLLPEEVRALNRRRQIDKLMRKVILGLAAVLVFWVGWVGVQAQIVAAQNASAQKEWNEIQTGKSAFMQILALEKARRAAMKGAVDLPAMMKELSRLTPSPIVVHSMRFSRDEGAFSLSATANAGQENVKLIRRYVDNLTASPFFSSVTLGQTMEEEGEGRVRFQVDGRVRALA